MPDIFSDNQILVAHHAAIETIKKDLFARAQQQVDFSNDNILLDAKFLEGLTLSDDDREKFKASRLDIGAIRQQAKADILTDYNQLVEEIANVHLARPQTAEIVSSAQEKLKLALQKTKDKLFTTLLSQLVEAEQSLSEEGTAKLDQALRQSGSLNQSFDKASEQLDKSLTGFAPLQLEAFKAKLQLQNEQANNKKTDANLTANALDPNTFSAGQEIPTDYDYKIDIDNLCLQLRNRLTKLKPDEKLHIEVEIPPDRPDILKKTGEAAFQYRITLIAFIFMCFIAWKMRFKDDETRVLKALGELAEKNKLMLNPEEIMFSVKARGNDGKMQTVQEPRPLNPAALNCVDAWRLKKIFEGLSNSLYKSKPMDKSCAQEAAEEESDSHGYSQLRMGSAH